MYAYFMHEDAPDGPLGAGAVLKGAGAVPPPLIESAARQTPAKWQSTFAPRRVLRNAHLETLAGNFLPRKAVCRLLRMN